MHTPPMLSEQNVRSKQRCLSPLVAVNQLDLIAESLHHSRVLLLSAGVEDRGRRRAPVADLLKLYYPIAFDRSD